MENRLQKFVSDLRNLADSDKLNVSVNGKYYMVDRRSVKAGRWTNACDQRNRSRRVGRSRNYRYQCDKLEIDFQRYHFRDCHIQVSG